MAYNTVMTTGSPSLRILDVSTNGIGNDGVSLCLQHINTLTELRVAACCLSVGGTVQYLATSVIMSIAGYKDDRICYSYIE